MMDASRCWSTPFNQNKKTEAQKTSKCTIYSATFRANIICPASSSYFWAACDSRARLRRQVLHVFFALTSYHLPRVLRCVRVCVQLLVFAGVRIRKCCARAPIGPTERINDIENSEAYRKSAQNRSWLGVCVCVCVFVLHPRKLPIQSALLGTHRGKSGEIVCLDHCDVNRRKEEK